MMEFLRILFFGKILLLTPQPVDLNGLMVLDLPEPIEAVTTGAALEIDVSAMITKPRDEAILDFRHRVDEMFPESSIEATLVGENDLRVAMKYDGNHAYSTNAVRLVLSSDDGVPTGVEFSRVEISSASPLRSVTVHWRNYKK